MKKTILTLIMIAGALGAGAQGVTDLDTLSLNDLYRYDKDPSFMTHLMHDSVCLYHDHLSCFYQRSTYATSSDPDLQEQTVYGLAFLQFPCKIINSQVPCTPGNLLLHCLVFEYNGGDSINILRRTPFCRCKEPSYLFPPITNRINVTCFDSCYICDYDSSKIRLPVYEVYLDTPYFALNPYFIGISSEYCDYSSEYRDYDDSVHHPLLPVVEIEYANYELTNPRTIFLHIPHNPMHTRLHRYGQLALFPILTPSPQPYNNNCTDPETTGDSTQVNDTTGHSAVYSPQMMERYTQLMPSATQAGQQVAVLSSFHLQAVEVYDAAGRLVQRQPASGIGATIETANLPAGNYLVRLLTTAGSVTKKLLLQ